MKTWLGLLGMAGLVWAGAVQGASEPWVFRLLDGTAQAVAFVRGRQR